MTIVNKDSQKVLVEDVKINDMDHLMTSINFALSTNDIEPQKVFFLKVPDFCKKKLYSKDWYWNGTEVTPV